MTYRRRDQSDSRLPECRFVPQRNSDYFNGVHTIRSKLPCALRRKLLRTAVAYTHDLCLCILKDRIRACWISGQRNQFSLAMHRGTADVAIIEPGKRRSTGNRRASPERSRRLATNALLGTGTTRLKRFVTAAGNGRRRSSRIGQTG
jgi:hypothetical protein